MLLEKGKEKITIEIETGNSNAIENIKKCSEGNFSLVVSVPEDRRIEAHIKEGLRNERVDKKDRVFVISSKRLE